MARINRKQVPLCRPCHQKVHKGTYAGMSLRHFQYIPPPYPPRVGGEERRKVQMILDRYSSLLGCPFPLHFFLQPYTYITIAHSHL